VNKKKIVLVALTLMFSVFANATEDMRKQLLGSWVASIPYGKEATLTTQLTFEDDTKFSGFATVNNMMVWQFSGTWNIDGNRVTYNYVKSTLDLKGKNTDSDIITSISDSKFTYSSTKSGKTGSYERVKN